MPAIFKRQYADTCDVNDFNCGYSAWYNWARWLVLALVIIAVIAVIFSLSCISARRRRSQGAQPYRGTAWTLGMTPAGHNPPTYNQQPQPQVETQSPYYWNANQNAAPPAYSPPPNGRNDMELQQPDAVYGGYRAGESAYEPPKEPPPGRT